MNIKEYKTKLAASKNIGKILEKQSETIKKKKDSLSKYIDSLHEEAFASGVFDDIRLGDLREEIKKVNNETMTYKYTDVNMIFEVFLRKENEISESLYANIYISPPCFMEGFDLDGTVSADLKLANGKTIRESLIHLRRCGGWPNLRIDSRENPELLDEVRVSIDPSGRDMGSGFIRDAVFNLAERNVKNLGK